MTRHGQNATARPVYSHAERQKDARESGYGSDKVRLGKDSIKEFDCCSLTLQPCKQPVVTPDGHLFDKEAILEYIIHQKKENARKLKEYEKQKSKLKKEKTEEGIAQQEEKIKKFIEKGKLSAKPEASTSSSVSNMVGGKDKALPSFWIPSLTPEAKETVLQKPKDKVYCPMSGKTLKLKDLLDVKFTPIKDGDKSALIVKQARYVCPVTNDVLSNSVPVAVLRTSGHVVTMEAVETLIKKDMLDPMNGAKLTEKDIIPLQRGATGFTAVAGDLVVKKDGPAMPNA